MAAVDRQLAAMLRLRMEEQQAKKEASQQQLHFKQRVLDLLDALARRSRPPPSLLLLPLPLLKMLVAIASRASDRPLPERTTGLLRNRLAKLTIRAPWPHDVRNPMGPHETPWDPLGPMGTAWEPMGTHGDPWVPDVPARGST